MITIGIIGLGHMGGFHAAIVQQLAHAKLIGIADHTIAHFEKIQNPDVIKTTDYTEWINNVDAVIIAVPTDLHFLIGKDCLQRGKHVLIEKPLTRTVKQAEELFALAKKHNLVLHVGHVERFNAAIKHLKEIIHEPYFIESHRLGPFTHRPVNDSVIIDLMIHDIDIILSLINSPVRKSSIIGSNIKTDKCDLAALSLNFDNNALAKVVSSRTSHKRKRTMRVHQKNCYIDLDFATQEIVIHRLEANNTENSHSTYQETVEHLKIPKVNALELEILYFLQAISTGMHMFNPEHDISALALAIQVESELARC